MSITLEQVKQSEEITSYIRKADERHFKDAGL